MHLLRKRYATWFLLASSAAWGSLSMAAAEQPAFDSIVQDAAQQVMQQYKIPGLAIALTVDGKQRFYNYGVASKTTQQKVSSDTLFEIGSISKTFTATLASYAQAMGQLSLADSPSQYLPQLKGSPFDQVTLLNLATHTAGGFPLQVPDNVQNRAQLMDYFKGWQPTFAPNTYRTYANPSIGMLGMIAAKSMNLPYAQALEQRLFPMLGMTNSYIDVPANKLPLYAQGYNKQDVPVRLNPGVLAAEAYGVKTTSRDLLRFVEANLGGAPLEDKLNRALTDTRTGYYRVGAMTQDLIWEQYTYQVQLNALLEGNADQMIYDSNPVTTLHPPLAAQQAVWVNKTGSTGGFSAYVAFVPEKQLGIVLLANKSYPNEPRIRLAHHILSALDCCAPVKN
jgi:beta-lactamase class C